LPRLSGALARACALGVKIDDSVLLGSPAPGAPEVHVSVVFPNPSDVKAERQFFFVDLIG
jgi:hypothetical protein